MECIELSFAVPWGTIAGKAWGNPGLPPVLMVHGIQDNAGSFDRIMPLLSSEFYYLCVDLPGHGKSSRFPKGVFLDVPLYLSSIRRIVVQLEWTRFCYVGHSLGGQLGLYYAAFYPEEVEKLIVLDTLAPRSMTHEGYLNHWRESFGEMIKLENKLLNGSLPNYTYEEALRKMMNNRMAPISREAAEMLAKRALKQKNPNSYYFSADQRLKFGIYAPITTELQLSVISKVSCPVLLVITNFYLNYLEKYRKNCYDYETLRLVEKKNNFSLTRVTGNHDVHNNTPEVVAPHINKFLLRPKSAL